MASPEAGSGTIEGQVGTTDTMDIARKPAVESLGLEPALEREFLEVVARLHAAGVPVVFHVGDPSVPKKASPEDPLKVLE